MSISSASPDGFAVVELVSVAAPDHEAAGPALREMPFRADAWRPDEIDDLKSRFDDDIHLEEIAEHLDRPLHSVRTKIYELGLRRNSVRPWTAIDDADLSRRYGLEPTSTIARDLARSCAAVYARAQLLDLAESNPPAWTEWEDTQLEAGYRKAMPVARIAGMIGRPLAGTVSRASKLGLHHPSKPADWSDEELARALELAEAGRLYADIIEQLASEGFPRRSKAGFGPKIRAAGYGRGWGRDWTPEEDDLLREAYRAGKSLTPLQGRLCRSQHSIRWRAGALGLQGTHSSQNGFRGGPDWSEDDINCLKALYGTMSNAKLAERLGRTKLAVSTRANVLGLVHGYIRPWSAQDMLALQTAFEHDIAIADLANALGRKAMSVSKFATQHGLRFGRRARRHRTPSASSQIQSSS